MSSWALVTGASSGIGLELARVLASEGWNLVLVARRLDRLEELAEGLRELHGIEAETIQADLSEPASPRELYRTVRERDILPQVLVNNAGFGELGPFPEIETERLVAMVTVNCSSLALLTRLFLPEMIARGGGRVLNVSSVAAFQPGPFMATYYATKAFVQSLSEALAEELAQKGVTVTALCPGPTRSEFQQEARMDTAKYFSGNRIPTAQEVARFGYRAMMRGQRVAIHTLRYKFLVSISRFLPRKLITRLLRKTQEGRA